MSFKIELMQPAVTKKITAGKKRKLIIFYLQKLVKTLTDFLRKIVTEFFYGILNLIFSLTHLKNLFFYKFILLESKVKIYFLSTKTKEVQNFSVYFVIRQVFQTKTNKCL